MQNHGWLEMVKAMVCRYLAWWIDRCNENTHDRKKVGTFFFSETKKLIYGLQNFFFKFSADRPESADPGINCPWPNGMDASTKQNY